jgi:hypothetical protein
MDVTVEGFAILPDVFDRLEIEALIRAVSMIEASDAVRTRTGVYAVHNLLMLAASIRELADSSKLRAILEEHFSVNAFPVRATLFDKTASANWLVPWHQDLTICVANRVDVAGFGPWTIKAGVCHVQPPVSILENMLSLRIHLDDCDESNGALRVLPGTHRLGRLTPSQIAEQVRAKSAVIGAVKAGGVLLMRPLLLHASSSASQAAHRRVIHIDYAFSPLPAALRWT